MIQGERFHQLAKELMSQRQRVGDHVITSNYILAELVALLTSPLRVPRPTQIRFIGDLEAATWVQIVHIDSALDKEAWNLWKARPDKQWSLVDCASFTVMRHRRLTEALTTDNHFEQAGFVKLLK